MIHLLLCFPGTCPTLPLFSPPPVIPLVHSENRSVSHSCCLDFPGGKKKEMIWEHIHTRPKPNQSILHTLKNSTVVVRIQTLSLAFALSSKILVHSVKTTFKSLCFFFHLHALKTTWNQLQTAHCLYKMILVIKVMYNYKVGSPLALNTFQSFQENRWNIKSVNKTFTASKQYTGSCWSQTALLLNNAATDQVFFFSI